MKPEKRDLFNDHAAENRYEPEKEYNQENLNNLSNADIAICRIF
jgi:hypothetical protein